MKAFLNEIFRLPKLKAGKGLTKNAGLGVLSVGGKFFRLDFLLLLYQDKRSSPRGNERDNALLFQKFL